MKRVTSLLLFAIMLGGLSGCIIAPGPGPHPGAHWVRGYYGPYGGWHPGHWQ
jgi:hypothetical protein